MPMGHAVIPVNGRGREKFHIHYLFYSGEYVSPGEDSSAIVSPQS